MHFYSEKVYLKWKYSKVQVQYSTKYWYPKVLVQYVYLYSTKYLYGPSTGPLGGGARGPPVAAIYWQKLSVYIFAT